MKKHTGFSLAEMIVVLLLVSVVVAATMPVMSVMKKNASSCKECDAIPVGTIFARASGNVPNDYLECDGSSKLRTDYPKLYNEIQCTYGCADATHFNVPDLRGEFLRGWDHGKGVDNGRIIGSNQISTQVIVDNDASEVIGALDWTNNNLTNLGYEPADSSATGYVHYNTANWNSSMGSTFFRSIRPRNVAVMYIIKAK